MRSNVNRFAAVLIAVLAVAASGCASVLHKKPEEKPKVVYGYQNFRYLKPSAEYQTAFNEAQMRYVRLVGKRGNETSEGSGTWIDSETILSCFHMLEPGGITFLGEEKKENILDVNQILRVSPYFDLSLFQVEKNPLPVTPVKVAQKVDVGEELVSYGNARAVNGYLKLYHVAKIMSEGRFIYLQEAAMPGTSGSALFNLKGELVGVMTRDVTGPISEDGRTSVAFSVATGPTMLAKFVLHD